MDILNNKHVELIIFIIIIIIIIIVFIIIMFIMIIIISSSSSIITLNVWKRREANGSQHGCLVVWERNIDWFIRGKASSGEKAFAEKP